MVSVGRLEKPRVYLFLLLPCLCADRILSPPLVFCPCPVFLQYTRRVRRHIATCAWTSPDTLSDCIGGRKPLKGALTCSVFFARATSILVSRERKYRRQAKVQACLRTHVNTHNIRHESSPTERRKSYQRVVNLTCEENHGRKIALSSPALMKRGGAFREIVPGEEED